MALRLWPWGEQKCPYLDGSNRQNTSMQGQVALRARPKLLPAALTLIDLSLGTSGWFEHESQLVRACKARTCTRTGVVFLLGEPGCHRHITERVSSMTSHPRAVPNSRQQDREYPCKVTSRIRLRTINVCRSCAGCSVRQVSHPCMYVLMCACARLSRSSMHSMHVGAAARDI